MAVQWYQRDNLSVVLGHLADPQQKLDGLTWEIINDLVAKLFSKKTEVLSYRDNQCPDLQNLMQGKLIDVVDKLDRDFEQQTIGVLGAAMGFSDQFQAYREASGLFKPEASLERSTHKVERMLALLFCSPDEEQVVRLEGEVSDAVHYGKISRAIRDGGGIPVPPDVREMQTRLTEDLDSRRQYFEAELEKLRGEIIEHKRALEVSQRAYEELMAEESGAAGPRKRGERRSKTRVHIPQLASAAHVQAYQLHQRVTRWGEKRTEETLATGSAERRVEIRMRHHLPGTETLLDDSTYAFKTETGYALLAKIVYGDKGLLGVLRFGIDDHLIYHRYFEPIDGRDLKTILGIAHEVIPTQRSGSAQEASLYKIQDGENNVKIFTFPDEDYSLEVYPT